MQIFDFSLCRTNEGERAGATNIRLHPVFDCIDHFVFVDLYSAGQDGVRVELKLNKNLYKNFPGRCRECNAYAMLLQGAGGPGAVTGKVVERIRNICVAVVLGKDVIIDTGARVCLYVHLVCYSLQQQIRAEQRVV